MQADNKKMVSRNGLVAVMMLFGVAGCAAPRGDDEPQERDHTKFSAQTYYAAGQLAEAQHGWARAIAEYRLSITAQGPHTPAMYRLGIIYTQLKDYPQAIAAWQQYVTATYGAALAYGDLAYTYQLAGEDALARQAYLSALQKEPANATVRMNYGRMLAQQGDITGAEQQMSGVLTEAQVHYQIGIICQEQKKYAQAREEFTQAIALDPQLLDAKARLADLDDSSPAAK